MLFSIILYVYQLLFDSLRKKKQMKIIKYVFKKHFSFKTILKKVVFKNN